MALSSPRKPGLEGPDSSSPDAGAGRVALGPDAEDNMDVILVGSTEVLCPPPRPPGRDLIAYEVTVNQRDIEDICLCCGSFQVHTQHPLFEGGMCAPCKDKFLETLFQYDNDGYQGFCSICGSGDTLLICESPDCTRCYCFECVDVLVSPGTAERVQAMSLWVCFLCLPFSSSGLLHRRRKWRAQLKAFQDREAVNSLEVYETVPAWRRAPLRVLSLFGNIKKELASLGFWELGSASGAGLTHLDDVTDVVRREVEEWGPFDLVYGSTPPRGYEGHRSPGWYLFQFHRLLQYARPPPGSPQPFFWMFVDSLLLTPEDQDAATRFLETEPVTLQDSHGGAVRSAVRVWSNIPAVRSKHEALAPEAELALLAGAGPARVLGARPPCPAALVKNCFLPLREYFRCCPRSALPLYE
ncbi:DNA (cytosine-5)-methyltransferase 3-like [Perognathus longimembris pacificus]|uniref:DNA (cytosine-5)-methyltransferase 3-like n=1 Tax=Perognathus longimembris pacificus TaxID=214514 RepID=UPI002019DAC7|nr:DNA (cytosine-5)-methyltransferase 3-like [Perognathus longimembris pacificus]